MNLETQKNYPKSGPQKAQRASIGYPPPLLDSLGYSPYSLSSFPSPRKVSEGEFEK
jgi:hypothetical protein